MVDEALPIHSIYLFVNIGDVLYHLSILISSSKVHKAWGAIGKLLISRAKLCFACSDGNFLLKVLYILTRLNYFPFIVEYD